jgi:hypothetical protein
LPPYDPNGDTVTATEAERRRAAGEQEFWSNPIDVRLARGMWSDIVAGQWDLLHVHSAPAACSQIAALLRALVLQELLITFSPPWEVST